MNRDEYTIIIIVCFFYPKRLRRILKAQSWAFLEEARAGAGVGASKICREILSREPVKKGIFFR